MKKILLITLVLVICVGCKTKIVNINGAKNEEVTSFEAFNDENYVWEGWSFSTNKVEQTK